MDWKEIKTLIQINRLVYLKVNGITVLSTLNKHPNATHWTTVDVEY